MQQEAAEEGSHTLTSVSSITYTADVAHHGSVITCTAVQARNGSVLYTDSQNVTLSITGAVPLIVVKTSSFGVYVGGLIAIGLVIFILTSSILTMLKTKRKVDSSNDSLSEYQSEIIINKNTLENIFLIIKFITFFIFTSTRSNPLSL